MFFKAIYSQQVYTYGPNEQIQYFSCDNDYVYITIKQNVTLDERVVLESQLFRFLDTNIVQISPQFMFKARKLANLNSLLKTNLGIDTNKIIVSSILYFSEDSTIQWGTQSIFVKTNSYNDLITILSSENIPYAEVETFADNLFLVKLNGMSDQSIHFANLLQESGLVDFAEPNFGLEITPATNPMYTNQWGLNNTGQYGGTPGIDIKAEDAWLLTKGNGIKVAVLDEGVELNHPDLYDNLSPGYDAVPGQYSFGGCNATDSHGTCCTGIIAATDNNIGVVGVAHKSIIIPMRIAFKNNAGKWTCYRSWEVDAIEKAYTTFGADILSCSWGGGSESYSLNFMIAKAKILGRNGNGCIIVFSSGNKNMSSVEYPSSLDEVISVGAIDRCGVRSGRIDIVPESCNPWGETWKPGSSYGEKLSVVAPGTNVYTTTIKGTSNFTLFLIS